MATQNTTRVRVTSTAPTTRVQASKNVVPTATKSKSGVTSPSRNVQAVQKIYPQAPATNPEQRSIVEPANQYSSPEQTLASNPNIVASSRNPDQYITQSGERITPVASYEAPYSLASGPQGNTGVLTTQKQAPRQATYIPSFGDRVKIQASKTGAGIQAASDYFKSGGVVSKVFYGPVIGGLEVAKSGPGLASAVANPKEVYAGAKEEAVYLYHNPAKAGVIVGGGLLIGGALAASGGALAPFVPEAVGVIGAGTALVGTGYGLNVLRGSPKDVGKALPEVALFSVGAYGGAKLGGVVKGESFDIPTEYGAQRYKTVGVEAFGKSKTLFTVEQGTPAVIRGSTGARVTALEMQRLPFSPPKPVTLGRQLGEFKASEKFSPSTFSEEFIQPATALGGKVSGKVIDYTPVEVTRIAAAQQASLLYRNAPGLKVKDVLFEVKELRSASKASKIIESFSRTNKGEVFGSATTLQLPKQYRTVPGDVDIMFKTKTVAELIPKVELLARRLRSSGEDVRVSSSNPLIVEFRGTGSKLVEVKSGIDQNILGGEEARGGFLGVTFGEKSVRFGKTRAITAGDQLARKYSGATIVTPGGKAESAAFSDKAGVYGKPARADKDIAGAVLQTRGLVSIDQGKFFRRGRAAKGEVVLEKFLGTYTPEERLAIETKAISMTGQDRVRLSTGRRLSVSPSLSRSVSSIGFSPVVSSISSREPRSSVLSLSPRISPSLSPISSPSPSRSTSRSSSYRSRSPSRSSSLSFSTSPSYSPSPSPSPLSSPSRSPSPSLSPSPYISPSKSLSPSPSPSPSPTYSPPPPPFLGFPSLGPPSRGVGGGGRRARSGKRYEPSLFAKALNLRGGSNPRSGGYTGLELRGLLPGGRRKGRVTKRKSLRLSSSRSKRIKL